MRIKIILNNPSKEELEKYPRGIATVLQVDTFVRGQVETNPIIEPLEAEEHLMDKDDWDELDNAIDDHIPIMA